VSDRHLESWWTIRPDDGQPVEVMLADDVAEALYAQRDAEVKADVYREASARLRVMLRRYERGPLPHLLAEIRDAIEHMAKGMPGLSDEELEQVEREAFGDDIPLPADTGSGR
jgi:hypothetical protein